MISNRFTGSNEKEYPFSYLNENLDENTGRLRSVHDKTYKPQHAKEEHTSRVNEQKIFAALSRLFVSRRRIIEHCCKKLFSKFSRWGNLVNHAEQNGKKTNPEA